MRAMRALVVPEDFRNDQYILKPLFTRLFEDLGWPRPKVDICTDPLLGGVNEALKSERIAEVVRQHGGMTDIFILCVDRDGVTGRRRRLDEIEEEFGSGGRVFLAENAWEEIETWALAGLNLPDEWRWADVRAEVHVKEQYFDEFARLRGLIDKHRSRRSRGRKVLGKEAARGLDAIRQKCPEDFDRLARRIEAAGAQA